LELFASPVHRAGSAIIQAMPVRNTSECALR
jgi:hypothetical protein